MESVPSERLSLFAEMESKYENNDTEYFVSLLNHSDYVVRTRATCILVDFGGEDKIPHIAQVLKNCLAMGKILELTYHMKFN